MLPFVGGVCLLGTVRDGDTTAPPLGLGGARNELAPAPVAVAGGEFAGADGWTGRGLVGSDDGGAGGESVGSNGVVEGDCDGGVSGWFVEEEDGEGGG